MPRGDDRDLTHGGCRRNPGSHQGMTRFMVSDAPFFLRVHDAILLLEPGNQALDRVLEIDPIDGILFPAGGQERHLV